MDSSLLSTMVGQMSEHYEIEVKSSLFSYPILSNPEKFLLSDKRNVIIYDKNVKQRCLELFPSQAFYIEIEIYVIHLYTKVFQVDKEHYLLFYPLPSRLLFHLSYCNY